MNLQSFNALSKEEASAYLQTCCGSHYWVHQMMQHFPFKNEAALTELSADVWFNECSAKDWLEAFGQHPKIGDKESLAEKFANTRHFAGNEQSGVDTASAELIDNLANANELYEKQHGFIFIVCATGKSAGDMFELLSARLSNSREDELMISANEQHKITVIRLRKLLHESNWSFLKPSQLTTHVLDTSVGKPAKGISILLKQSVNGQWRALAQGITNADGRITDLLAPNHTLQGNFKMIFETGGYFEAQKIRSFYPVVELIFTVEDDSHYHVPLLLNPFGFSTYRGS